MVHGNEGLQALDYFFLQLFLNHYVFNKKGPAGSKAAKSKPSDVLTETADLANKAKPASPTSESKKA